MTATLEQTKADLLRLIGLAQKGEEVVIVNQGQPVARLTGLTPAPTTSNRQAWLTKLSRLREATATGKVVPTSEQMLEDLRSERG